MGDKYSSELTQPAMARSALDKYAADLAQGLKTGVGDITRNAVADIGNRYQEILMADATIKPGDTLPVTGDMAQEIAYEAGKADIEHAVEPPKHEPDMDR
jgi:hypothetical protein